MLSLGFTDKTKTNHSWKGLSRLLEVLGRTSLVVSEPTLTLYLGKENRSPLKSKQEGSGRPAELELHKIGSRDRLCGSRHWQEEQENQHKRSPTCSFASVDEVEAGHFNCKGCSENREMRKAENETSISQNSRQLFRYCNAMTLQATKTANLNVILKPITIFHQTPGRAY